MFEDLVAAVKNNKLSRFDTVLEFYEGELTQSEISSLICSAIQATHSAMIT